MKKHLQDAPFKIYNASAGSGKTHTLTKAYLKIILTSTNGYAKILALTFTNKAVNEMKTRILESLFQFGQVSNIDQAPALFLDLMQELEFDVQTLAQRSKVTLKQILHNYAFYDISTIDKFTHRIIRTFAKDLKIPQNFEVILDNDLLLDEAVARLVHKAGTDELLTQVLLDFALEKIDNDKSWDITLDLFTIGKLLFRENHADHLEKFKNKTITDFLGLKKTLQDRSNEIQKGLIANAGHALHLIDTNGLEYSDFTGSYFPKFMAKVKEGDLILDFNAGWKQNFESTPLYNKSAPDRIKSTLDKLHPIFVGIFSEIKESFYQLSFLKNVYNNIVPLTVLNALNLEVKTLQSERDQVSISEFNAIISREIKNQPAPFIYERLGEKYRHYFIDEFQDTSTQQWSNLIPLIDNALASESGSLFLVGDAKQAIYRWRGGRAEQFLDLVNQKTNPFVVLPVTESLPTNYRSHEEIIRFNNDFFTVTSPFLNNARYHSLFVNGSKQRYNTKKGGMVQLAFIEKNDDGDRNVPYCLEVLKTIELLSEKKYGYEDICILVRGNKEGVLLADYLTQNRIPTISSESLLLVSSEKVQFLIHFLEYLNDNQNKNVVYQILAFLSLAKNERHRFIYENQNKIDEFLRTVYHLDREKLIMSSVYDILELAIKNFDLASSSDAYLTYFMDFVLEVEQKKSTGIPIFLNTWESKKEKLSITAPDNLSAVRIMTIHKAKGLEFPIVIFPFANENIYKRMDKKLWLPVSSENFNGFEEVLVNEKKEMVEYGPQASALYNEEEHKMELDALNMLYVALTRAEKALFIISEKDLTSKGEHKTDFFSGLFINYLKEKGLWHEEEWVYTFGSLEKNRFESQQAHQKTIDFGYTNKDRPEFRILTRSSMLWDTDLEDALSQGNRMHYILSLIETEKDIAKALNTAMNNGDIAADELNVFRTKIEAVIHHPQLRTYYEEGHRIENERAIITSDSMVLRPDRIVLQNTYATVIDYKTGKRNPKYKEQLYNYTNALEAMGYIIKNRILVYINEEIVAEFV